MANDEVSSMMSHLGIKDINELFSDIPPKVRKNSIDIPDGISEFEILNKAREMASKNRGHDYIRFLGCGIYDRIIPSSVDSILGRSEFLTSYTPYQPEVSQGMLQSMFEYQSILSDLMKMDVTNSSMYDGSTALGEAIRMAFRINGKNEVLYPENIYESKLEVMRSYIWGLGIKMIPYRIDENTGYLDLSDIESKVGENTCSVIVENPNSYGILDENVLKINEIKGGALLVSYVDPISLGLVKPPGDYGADISVAEGQQLGIHQFFGGPLLGIMSFRKEYARKSPGRIIGQSVDKKGKDSYVMTLQTREQHIRREKAMSNICTNQALMALAAAAYVSTLGSSGLKKVAAATLSNSRKLRKTISGIKGFDADIFKGTSFSDVPVRSEYPVEKVRSQIHDHRILGAMPLADLMPAVKDKFPYTSFFSVTEKNDDYQIGKLRECLEAIR